MSAATFDTLGTARDLEAAGIERIHAEAIAQAIHHGDERAGTKADLDALEYRIDAKLTKARRAPCQGESWPEDAPLPSRGAHEFADAVSCPHFSRSLSEMDTVSVENRRCTTGRNVSHSPVRFGQRPLLHTEVSQAEEIGSPGILNHFGDRGVVVTGRTDVVTEQAGSAVEENDGIFYLDTRRKGQRLAT